MAQREFPVIHVEDYLLLDKNSTHARYEYLDGELRMLSGGSPYHAAIIANLITTVNGHLTGSSCWTYSSDVRLKLSETRYVHPDVTVSCDERDHMSDDSIHYPLLVIEVLSPSTEATDKIKKLIYYQECPTIQEYVMVDSQSIHIEVYHRQNDIWTYQIYGPNNVVTLASINLQFPIQDIYRGMRLTGNRNGRNNKKQ